MNPALDTPEHHAWLDGQLRSMLAFAQGGILNSGGFAMLDASGTPMPDRRPQLFITARMVHAASVGVLRGIPGSQRLLDHGMASLAQYFADQEHGGWWSDPGAGPTQRKMTYDHVHVGLAASSAAAAGHPDAPALIAQVIAIVDTYLWDEGTGTLRESFAADWSDEEAYRGANANMHATEAFLALGDVTGDPMWHERALRIADRIINQGARRLDWLVPEHFDRDWVIDPEYNRDDPDHPFRPYGATYGHLLEWARFLLNLDASPAVGGQPWLVEAAVALTESALDRGWAADGHPGIVYTVDWQRRPVSALRMHWPVCEGIQVTSALARLTDDAHWRSWYARLWEHARDYFIDENGQWRNELDAHLRPSETVWPGRPDVYHCVGAYIVPTVGLTPFLTMAAGGQTSRLD